MQEQNRIATEHTETTERLEPLKSLSYLDQISEKIVKSALKIHRHFGPGLLEKSYKECLYYDLIQNHGLFLEKEKYLPINFETLHIPNAYRIDLLVEDLIVIEIKSCGVTLPVHQSQLLSYMRLGNYRLGYIINFNHKLIRDGIRRLAL